MNKGTYDGDTSKEALASYKYELAQNKRFFSPRNVKNSTQ